MRKTCQYCKWWEKDIFSELAKPHRCKRMPPTESERPRTDYRDYCGEWSGIDDELDVLDQYDVASILHVIPSRALILMQGMKHVEIGPKRGKTIVVTREALRQWFAAQEGRR